MPFDLLNQCWGTSEWATLAPTAVLRNWVNCKSIGVLADLQSVPQNGAVVSQLEKLCGAGVHFKKSTGREPFENEGVRLVLTGTLRACTESLHTIGRLIDGAQTEQNSRAPSQPVKFIVPDQTVGLVLGRRGATVKELSTSSGATFDIPREQVHPACQLV